MWSKTEHERETAELQNMKRRQRNRNRSIIHPVKQQDQRQLLAGCLGASASPAGTMWTDSPLLRDAGAAVLTGVAAAVVLRFWEEVANRALLDQVTPLLPSSLPCCFLALTNLVLLLLINPIKSDLFLWEIHFCLSLNENSFCAPYKICG